MSHAAVVVSYNRIELLKKCLHALENQTHPLDEVIVVDNGSTDGSADYVEAEHPDVTLFRTGANLGGAGGFAWGVEIALAHGHDTAWLMDDDAEPELDAAAPLIATFERMNPRPAFLASLVTTQRGAVNRNNSPEISQDTAEQVRASELGGVAIDSATFVGVMINLHEAATTHLPLDDFFIWFDDLEYTNRLSHRGFAMMLMQSMINHPAIKPVRKDMAGRLFYFARNSIWTTRERESNWSTDLVDVLGLSHHCLNQFFAARDKKLWARSVSRGYWQGFTRRPRHRRPGSLLATLTPQQRAAIGC